MSKYNGEFRNISNLRVSFDCFKRLQIMKTEKEITTKNEVSVQEIVSDILEAATKKHEERNKSKS